VGKLRCKRRLRSMYILDDVNCRQVFRSTDLQDVLTKCSSRDDTSAIVRVKEYGNEGLREQGLRHLRNKVHHAVKRSIDCSRVLASIRRERWPHTVHLLLQGLSYDFVTCERHQKVTSLHSVHKSDTHLPTRGPSLAVHSSRVMTEQDCLQQFPAFT
jgi:hypothetical protein